MTAEVAITLTLSSSKRLMPLCWTVSMITVLFCLFYPSYWQARIVALALCAVGLYQIFFFLKRQAQINKLLLSPSQSFVWINQVKVKCDLLASPFVTRYLKVVVLRLQPTQQEKPKKIVLVLLPDSMTADQWRRLRVFFATVTI